MAKKIKVDPAQLDSVSSKIKTQSEDYRSLYTQLYSEVAHMSSAWKGADNTAYTKQIEGFKDDLENMKKVMDEFANFLTTSAKAYREAQNAIIQAAGKLAN